MSFPRYIALCGWPTAGKDEVAASLNNHFGAVIIDDGLCLRKAVPHLFGCEPDDPFTHKGKSKVYDTIDGPHDVRWMLGELGTALEDRFGDGFMPHNAMKHADDIRKTTRQQVFVFPSVRKTQPQYYKNKGGFVVEVQRPTAIDSGNDFDRWDQSVVDMTIHNDSTLEALDRAVHNVFWDLNTFDEFPRTVRASNFS